MAKKTNTAALAKAEKAGAAKARAAATKKIKAVTSDLKAKFKAQAARKATRDAVGFALDPVLTGAGGAYAVDKLMAFLPDAVGGGARGDVIKGAGAILLGYFGQRFVRNEYVRSASIGTAIVNMHRLMTRVETRVSAGTLNGLFRETHDMDLAGLGASRRGLPNARPVLLQLSNGQQIPGLQDTAGNLFDQRGALLPIRQRAATDRETRRQERKGLSGYDETAAAVTDDEIG